MIIHDLTPNTIDDSFLSHVVEKTSIHLRTGNNLCLYLSGGSVMSTYSHLTEMLLTSQVPLEKLQCAQIDERYDLNPMHQNSNQRMIIEETEIVKKLQTKGVRFRFILNNHPSEQEVFDYERFLQRFLESQKTINIALMGMGADGHIAGIKPDDDEVRFKERFVSDGLVASYRAMDFPRITVTLKTLEKFDHLFFYVRGEEKRMAVQKISEEIPLHKFPARWLAQKDTVEMFTDLAG